MTETSRLRLPDAAGCSCIDFATGTVRLRLARQAAAALLGESKDPLLIYRFTAPAPRPADDFLLLAGGAPPPRLGAAPADVLAATCTDAPLDPAGCPDRWRRDPGVRALACELRRALLDSSPSPPPYLEHLVRAIFLRAQAVSAAADSTLGGLSGPRLERVMAAIQSGLRDRLSLEDLARTAGMSRARFAEAFRRSMGASPHAYVRMKRIEAVRAAIDAGEHDLARLAARFGFSSHAHMTTVFRTTFGTTPSAYRRAVTAVGRPGDAARRPDFAVRRSQAGAAFGETAHDSTRFCCRAEAEARRRAAGRPGADARGEAG